MPLNHGGYAPVIRNPFARAGSLSGAQKRAEFIHNFLSVCPTTELLWLPLGTETTTSTDVSRNARVLTYEATAASRYATVGSGLSVSFNGTSNYGSWPDADALSFGDSVNDEPFSIVAWINPTDTAAARAILTKSDATTGATKREWALLHTNAGALDFILTDESAGATIRITPATALTAATWAMVVATYNGSKVYTGMRLYKDGVLLAQTNNGAGAYVAMENLTTAPFLGAQTNAAAIGSYFLGSMACASVVRKELNIDEIWGLKALGNAFFALSL